MLKKVILLAVCLSAICWSQVSAVVFPYMPRFDQCNEGQNWSILKGLGSDEACKFGDSVASLVVGLNLVKANLPDPTVPITMKSLTEFMVNYEYFDRCPEGVSAGECLVYAPVEVLLALGPSTKIDTTETSTPSMEACNSAARGESMIFIREKSNALRLVLACDASGSVTVLNTRGGAVRTVAPESIAKVHVLDTPTPEQHALMLKKANPVKAVSYPLFKQCDQRWKSRVMGTNGQTICQVGCFMTSTAMALNGHGIPHPNGTVTNPAVLNDWLRRNGGYTPGSALIQTAFPAYCKQQIANTKPCESTWPSDGMHRSNDIPLATIQGYLNRGRIVIPHVNGGRHFVLATGYDKNKPDTIYVNDPGAGKPSFSYKNDIVGWRIFDFKGPKSKIYKSITDLAREWSLQN